MAPDLFALTPPLILPASRPVAHLVGCCRLLTAAPCLRLSDIPDVPVSVLDN